MHWINALELCLSYTNLSIWFSFIIQCTLAAVVETVSGVATDDKFGIMITLNFQWLCSISAWCCDAVVYPVGLTARACVGNATFNGWQFDGTLPWEIYPWAVFRFEDQICSACGKKKHILERHFSNFMSLFNTYKSINVFSKEVGWDVFEDISCVIHLAITMIIVNVPSSPFKIQQWYELHHSLFLYNMQMIFGVLESLLDKTYWTW